MLATLEFDFAKDADGNDITFQPTFTNSITEYVLDRFQPLVCLAKHMSSRPNPFPCRLTPRPHVNKDMLERVLAQ